jgi:hypothetical protein
MSSRARLGLSLAATGLLVVLAGCGGSDDAAPPDETSAAGPTSAPQTSESTGQPSDGPATDSPSTSEFTQGPTQDPNGSTSARAKASRIAASELPGLNDAWKWRLASQGNGSGDSPPSLCMLTSLESIGAKATYRTDYDSPLSKTARATVITAVFPDQQTAVLAKTVLRSWHAQCESRLKKELGYERVKVTAIRKSPADVATGEHWLSTFGPVQGRPNDSWFQSEGFVEDADTMTYIAIVSAGQDYDYEPGQEPIDLALVVGAAQLAASR